MDSAAPASCIASVPFDRCSDTTAFALDPVLLIGAVLLTLVLIAVVVTFVRR